MRVSLTPNPETLWPPIHRIEVEIRRRGDQLWLNYLISGDTSRVRWPGPAAAERTDGLWAHTCVEAFIRTDTGYHEFNLATSGQWASYRFDGYRQGMTVADEEVVLKSLEGRGDYTDIGGLFDLPPGADRLALSAVIEDVDGGVSYWAFAHAPGKPDFHHPDSFALILPPPEPV